MNNWCKNVNKLPETANGDNFVDPEQMVIYATDFDFKDISHGLKHIQNTTSLCESP